MIKYIDDRCKDWARQVADRVECGTVSLWVKILSGGGSGSHTGLIAVSDEAMAVESVVANLGDHTKPVVIQQYLGRGNSIENAQALRMSKKKFYELLDCAHIEIDRGLAEIESE